MNLQLKSTPAIKDALSKKVAMVRVHQCIAVL